MICTFEGLSPSIVKAVVDEFNKPRVEHGTYPRLIIEDGCDTQFWIRTADKDNAGFRIAMFASDGFGIVSSRGCLRVNTSQRAAEARGLVKLLTEAF